MHPFPNTTDDNPVGGCCGLHGWRLLGSRIQELGGRRPDPDRIRRAQPINDPACRRNEANWWDRSQKTKAGPPSPKGREPLKTTPRACCCLIHSSSFRCISARPSSLAFLRGRKKVTVPFSRPRRVKGTTKRGQSLSSGTPFRHGRSLSHSWYHPKALTARGKSRHGIRPSLHPGGDTLLSAHILPGCSRIAPGPAGAGTVSVLAGLSPRTANPTRRGVMP